MSEVFDPKKDAETAPGGDALLSFEYKADGPDRKGPVDPKATTLVAPIAASYSIWRDGVREIVYLEAGESHVINVEE